MSLNVIYCCWIFKFHVFRVVKFSLFHYKKFDIFYSRDSYGWSVTNVLNAMLRGES